MVCFESSISVDMANSLNPTDPCLKLKQINHLHRSNKRIPNPHPCDQSPYAAIDVVILISVISACSFLFYPCARILAVKAIELSEEVIGEIVRAPMVFGCLGLSIFFAEMALVAIAVCADGRCGKSGCRGLQKAAEFDIQLETEENVRRSMARNDGGLKRGLYEVQHRELEAELKKMAPPNGRAVLVFRASCGCSVGRMEVFGSKKKSKG